MIKTFSKKFAHTNLTFVGLGNMGYSMATNLLKNGYKVAGFDLNKSVTEKFSTEGGEKFDSMETAFKNSDVIMTMLPNSKAVNTIWELSYKTANKGTFLIDSSTISPIDAVNLSKSAKEKGFIPADAPVSGGVMGAQKATLSFMVGSDKEYFDKIKSILQPMGKNFFYCGENSSGQIAKICNNLCLGITMAGLSESLALGVKLGIDPKVLSNVMAVSSSRCWSLDTYNPIPGVMENVPSSRNYENGFSMELMYKDLRIALECLEKVKLDAKLSKITTEKYEKLKKDLPNKDFSYVYQDILNDNNSKK
jgi:3-hydroxyisobutyrate dehydrogenase